MDNLPRLGVNIDHVATLRNARGENYPSPLRAALLCKEYGADGITAHLREDRRHIRDDDIFTNMTPGTRLDNLAHKYYGDSSLWWIIARANGLTGTELQLKTQQRYRIPMSIKVILRDFASVNSEE